MPGENMFGQSFVPVTDTSAGSTPTPGTPSGRSPTRAGAVQGRQRRHLRGRRELRAAAHTRRNDYLIDRKLQKTKSYTGIKGVSEQDAAVQDSQGPIADRTREHLGPTDLGILRFRKLVMDCARDLQRGKEPEARPVRRPLRRPRRRLGHPQEQGPRHRDGRALRRSDGLCRPPIRRRRQVTLAASPFAARVAVSVTTHH